RARVHANAALAAAERDVGDGALPRHPRRQRRDLLERHVGVEADAAFGRAARDAVLHAKALEQPDRAVVHPHREPLDRGPARALHHVLDPRIELEPRRGLLELSLGVLERVQLAVDGHGHGSLHARRARGPAPGCAPGKGRERGFREPTRAASDWGRPASGSLPALLADCRRARNARTSAESYWRYRLLSSPMVMRTSCPTPVCGGVRTPWAVLPRVSSSQR